MKTRTVGFIGGGCIAAGLIRGLLNAGVDPLRMIVSDPNRDRLAQLRSEHAIRSAADNLAVLRESEVVVVCVEPRVVDSVLAGVATDVRREHVVVSVVAGLSCHAIEARLPAGSRVVRSMPSLPAMVGASVTAIAAGAHASADDVRIVREVFEAVGSVVTLEEALFNAVTGLSASGPAYVMLVIDALADGGVKVGLERDVALLLAGQAVLGAAKVLLDASGRHLGLDHAEPTLCDTSANGLEHTLRRTFAEAVAAAKGRADELGRQGRTSRD